MPSEAEIAAAKANTADWNSIPAKYQTAVATCKAVKIINGIDKKGTFQGSSDMTRAQAAIVLVSLSKLGTTGSGTQPDPVNPTEPDPVKPTKPAEITRSPFAFKNSSETVNQMMSRLNAEAPDYVEGYLSNGKPITEVNITEMIEAA